MEKLQKEISRFSLLFSKNVLERRSRIKNDKFQSYNKSSVVVPENKSVKKEVIGNVSNELLLSDFQTHDLVTNLSFVEDEQKSLAEDKCEINNHSEEDIDIKYSCVTAVSNVVDDTVNKIIAPKPTSLHVDQKTIKTSLADLVKCLKMPIIQLERLEPCGTRSSSKIVLENPEDMNIGGVPLNKSVIAGKETIKCENDSDENKPYKCVICGQGFCKIRDLEDHAKLHHKERSYICSFCHKPFQNRRLLKSHEVCHTENRPFNCDLCSKAFKWASDLKVHENTHSEKYSYKSSFRNTNSVVKRRELDQSGKIPHKFKCSFCQKSFRCGADLKRHERIHTNDRPYKCNLCEKSFIRTSHLDDHKKIHSEERQYICSVCGKSFKWINSLKEHGKTHTGEKPYKCGLCERSFRYLDNLKCHQRFHSGEKPFKCGFCEKSFGRFHELKMHENIESGERPFHCSLCNNSCARKQCLTQHMEQHHNSKISFNCSFCSKSFKYPSELKKHQMSHSREQSLDLECSNSKNLKNEQGVTILHNNDIQGDIKEEFILP